MADLEPAPPILALDPGPTVTTGVLYSRRLRCVVTIMRDWPNEEWIAEFRDRKLLWDESAPLCIEWIESMGMRVGAEVFETCRWVGRFEQAYPGPVHLITRHAVKLYLCESRRAKDADIHQALLDRFGPGRAAAVGVKAKPGPLFGVAGHAWSALAVAVTFAEQGPGR